MIIAENIHKSYRSGVKEVRAVDGMSLEIVKSGITAIIGPSGAGKSTLLHILGGLDKPTSGKVTIDGADLYGMHDRLRAKIRNLKIGFVFQFYHLLPEFTTLENVILPGLISGIGSRGKATELLKAVGLKGRMDHTPGELSGGESQRVAIARALINDPEILLCDEPTGNLDSKTSESIYGLLFDLKSRNNMALVIITHDEKISEKADRIIRIKDGKLA